MNFQTNRAFPNIKMAAWNACGIRCKRQELLVFLSEHKIDVLLVSETWLRLGDKFVLPNYKIYRSDRLIGRRGGAAIAVRSHYDHNRLPLPSLRFLEAAAVTLQIRGFGPLSIISVYAPPTRACDLDDYVQLFRGNTPVLVAGDLNAKHPSWGCATTNVFGRKLFSFVSSNSVDVHFPSTPTYFGPGTRPDVLDIALSRDIPFSIFVESAAELSSDHNPILISFGGEAGFSGCGLVRRVDWAEFGTLVDQLVEDVPSEITGGFGLWAFS